MNEAVSSSGATGVVKLLGDPAGLAEYQFRTALDLCAECRDYHAVWPYRRLSRTVGDVESVADIVGRRLREVVHPGGRILIAGAADAGVLALTAHATDELAPVIDVADRCPTPLSVCRRYAETQGLSITTHQLDLRSHVPARRYDVVFADCILQFVPRVSHVDVLRRLRETMTARGVLVITERARTIGEVESHRKNGVADLLNGLTAQGIKLPAAEASFVPMVNGMLNARRARVAACSAAEDLSSRVAAAGYRIRETSDGEDEWSVVLPAGDHVKVRIVVASPTSD